MTEHNKEYTEEDVTDEMLRAFSTQHPPGYHVVADGIAAAINASPLWAEVKELRAVMVDIIEAKRKDADTVCKLYTKNRELVEALRDVVKTAVEAPEINVLNYNEDQIIEANYAFGVIVDTARAVLAKHGRAGK